MNDFNYLNSRFNLIARAIVVCIPANSWSCSNNCNKTFVTIGRGRGGAGGRGPTLGSPLTILDIKHDTQGMFRFKAELHAVKSLRWSDFSGVEEIFAERRVVFFFSWRFCITLSNLIQMYADGSTTFLHVFFWARVVKLFE